ncbi:heavy metal-responsive transcriptional regulator [Gimesia benthica]|uniref:Heavy metal-responsive transcriptional regulator n=2 Tax=Gimesia benthica TaxID=2608982 RepID=A0A6I6AHP4_9PLAN|nr:heavy metal-responsive transcriptional regulator [Gimesia benthica]
MKETTMKLLTIGKVAEQAGVGIETVRFYEREGLLEKPTRSASGYRQFNVDVVKRLTFISRAKELGFTLKEIKELLSLRVDSEICCEDVKAKVDVKIADIESKIATLHKIKKALVRLSTACGKRKQTAECAILEALDGRKSTLTRKE